MSRTVLAILVTLSSAACEQPGAEPTAGSRAAAITLAGEVERKAVREASGLARSGRDPNVLWLHNDSGAKARLYAIDLDGRDLGRLKLDKADNRDWEDLASFVLDGTAYLVAADIGDNSAKHDESVLYVIEEPDLADGDDQEAEPAWRIRFSYPDGPRDAESIAVDLASERVLILSKRVVPPVLYAVPLRPPDSETIVAQRLGPVESLPPPTLRDIQNAPKTRSWHWQPTAMDIAPDGSAAIILTYAAVYYFPFDGDWFTTLNQQALGFSLAGIHKAEAAAFGTNSEQIFVTTEGRNPPLFRIDMESP